MKTEPNQSLHPTGDHNNIQPENGISIRQHIMIEMQKAMIIGLFSIAPKGEHHGHSHEEIANQALLHTDAVINALNDNP